MKRYKVTMHERQENGNIRKIVQFATIPDKAGIAEVEKFYGLKKPDIVDYKIEEKNESEQS